MNVLAYILLAGLALSVLQAAAATAMLVIVALILWGLLFKPRTLTAWFAALFVWWLLANQPVIGWSIVALGLLPLPKRRRESPTPPMR